MPIAALAAPLIATELGLDAAAIGGLGSALATGGIGAALGAGSGAAFGELTGSGAAAGAESGAIGGAAGPIGGALGEAAGIGETAGATIGAAAGGAGGAALTGGNPLLGAAESAAVPLTNAAFGSGGIFGSTPSATVTPTATATGAAGPAASAGSIGAQSAAAGSQIGLDPTAVGGAGPSAGGPSGGAGGGISGGAGVDGSSAMGLSDQNTFWSGGGTGTSQPIAGTSVGTVDAGGGGGFGADIMGLIQKNPGVLLSGGLLASQLFRGNEQYPAEKTLQTLATNTGTQGQALSGYIQSGTLPPGAQQAVTQATEGAKAELRSRFAQMGLSKSTMEGEALSNVDRQAAAQTFQFADQLLAQGANFTQISAQLQEQLLKTQAGTDQEFQRSLMAFAGGLGGLRGTTG